MTSIERFEGPAAMRRRSTFQSNGETHKKSLHHAPSSERPGRPVGDDASRGRDPMTAGSRATSHGEAVVASVIIARTIPSAGALE